MLCCVCVHRRQMPVTGVVAWFGFTPRNCPLHPRVPSSTHTMASPAPPSASAATKRVERLVRQVLSSATAAIGGDGSEDGGGDGGGVARGEASAQHAFDVRAMSRWLVR